MRYHCCWASLMGCAIVALWLANASTASANSAQQATAVPETAAAPKIDRSAFAQLFVPEITSHFGGFWAMPREACHDKNAGVLITVQGHAVTLADWAGTAWSLHVAGVAVLPGNPNDLLVDFKSPNSGNDDVDPIPKFVNFVKLTLSENGRLLTVTQPSGQSYKTYHFHFCAALPSD